MYPALEEYCTMHQSSTIIVKARSTTAAARRRGRRDVQMQRQREHKSWKDNKTERKSPLQKQSSRGEKY